jgi:hypothetical protein
LFKLACILSVMFGRRRNGNLNNEKERWLFQNHSCLLQCSTNLSFIRWCNFCTFVDINYQIVEVNGSFPMLLFIFDDDLISTNRTITVKEKFDFTCIKIVCNILFIIRSISREFNLHRGWNIENKYCLLKILKKIYMKSNHLELRDRLKQDENLLLPLVSDRHFFKPMENIYSTTSVLQVFFQNRINKIQLFSFFFEINQYTSHFYSYSLQILVFLIEILRSLKSLFSPYILSEIKC